MNEKNKVEQQAPSIIKPQVKQSDTNTPVFALNMIDFNKKLDFYETMSTFNTGLIKNFNQATK